jgi:hypothetical protein
MIPLLIPWILFVLLLVFIIFVALKKWKYAFILSVVIIILNWCFECVPLHILPKTSNCNKAYLSVMTFNVDGTMNDITEKAPHIVNIILRYSPDVFFYLKSVIRINLF